MLGIVPGQHPRPNIGHPQGVVVVDVVHDEPLICRWFQMMVLSRNSRRRVPIQLSALATGVRAGHLTILMFWLRKISS
jgi:hypothetical protein